MKPSKKDIDFLLEHGPLAFSDRLITSAMKTVEAACDEDTLAEVAADFLDTLFRSVAFEALKLGFEMREMQDVLWDIHDDLPMLEVLEEKQRADQAEIDIHRAETPGTVQ